LAKGSPWWAELKKIQQRLSKRIHTRSGGVVERLSLMGHKFKYSPRRAMPVVAELPKGFPRGVQI